MAKVPLLLSGLCLAFSSISRMLFALSIRMSRRTACRLCVHFSQRNAKLIIRNMSDRCWHAYSKWLQPFLWPARQTSFSRLVRTVLYLYLLHWLWARFPELYLTYNLAAWERLCSLYPGMNLTEWLSRDSGWRWGTYVTFPRLADQELLVSNYIVGSKHLCKAGPSREPVHLFLMVLSAPRAFSRRQAIRSTWGRRLLGSGGNVAMGFLVGTTPDAATNARVEKESDIYGDVIQPDVADIKFNIAHKELSGLIWAKTHCPDLVHYVKTDDDVYLVPNKLMEFSQAHREDKNVMYGPKFGTRCFFGAENMGFRLESGLPANYRLEASYPYMVMPAWLVQTYLYPKDVVDKLIAAAFNGPFWFYQGDAMLNGVCAERAGVKRVDVPEFRVSYTETIVTRNFAPRALLKWKYSDAIVVSHLQVGGAHLTQWDMHAIDDFMNHD